MARKATPDANPRPTTPAFPALGRFLLFSPWDPDSPGYARLTDVVCQSARHEQAIGSCRTDRAVGGCLVCGAQQVFYAWLQRLHRCVVVSYSVGGGDIIEDLVPRSLVRCPLVGETILIALRDILIREMLLVIMICD